MRPLLVLALLLLFATASTDLKIVVIMFENRSFDHLLGHLKAHNPKVNGLWGNETNPVDPLDPSSPRVRVSFDAEPVIGLNPNHSLDGTTVEIFGRKLTFGKRSAPDPLPVMNGFIKASNSTAVMRAYNATTVNVISTLAREFALFDAFYSSIPGPTAPNRMYFHSGTSRGSCITDYPVGIEPGYPQRTFYDDLEQDNKTWGVFFFDFPITLELKRIRKYPSRVRFVSDFLKMAATGALPQFSFLEPRWVGVGDLHETAQHPPHNILDGEMLLKTVYEAVRSGPEWNNTVLIVTYDEHGGLMDHVAPPMNVPNPDGDVNDLYHFNFTRLGLRVPFVVASPRVARGALYGEPLVNHYDHTSVMKTVRKWLQMNTTRPLTRREEWAASFEHILQPTIRTDCPARVALGQVPRRAAKAKRDSEPLTALQEEVVHLAADVVGETAPAMPMSRKAGAAYLKHALRMWKTREMK